MSTTMSFEEYLLEVESLSMEEFHELSHNEREEIKRNFQVYTSSEDSDEN